MPKTRERPYRIGDYWLSRCPKSGAWCRTWYDGERRQTRRASLATQDLERAKRQLEDWWIARHRPPAADAGAIQLAEVLLIYLQEHPRPWASEAQARIAIRHAAEVFGRASVTEAAARTADYVAHRRAAGVTDRTIARELSTLNAAGNYAARRPGGAVLQAFRPFAAPQLADAAADRPPRGHPWTLDQMARALDAVRPRDEHLFLFLVLTLNTLARPAAALELRLDAHQVDLEHGLLDLNPAGRRQTKKHRPLLPMTEALRPWLATAQRQWPARQRFVMRWVQADDAGRGGWRPIACVKTAFRSLRARAGLPETSTAYSVRHGLGRLLTARKVPRAQVAYMLGHRRLDTTDVYAPYAPEFMTEARDALDGILYDLDRRTDRPLLKPLAAVGPAAGTAVEPGTGDAARR